MGELNFTLLSVSIFTVIRITITFKSLTVLCCPLPFPKFHLLITHHNLQHFDLLVIVNELQRIVININK